MHSSSQTINAAGQELVLRLPEVAHTKSGCAFCPTDDVWDVFDGPFHLRLDFLRLKGDFAHVRDPLKACLLVFARSNSPYYTQNLFGVFVNFASTRDASEPFMSVSVAEVSNYINRLKPHERWKQGTFNALLQKWNALGLPGVEAEAALYLSERRKPGNEKGAAVRTRDPVHGPFSQAEYTALYKAVDAAYGQGELPQWAAVLTRLLFACGGRISQYAALKLRDLERRQDAFVLRLPQVKNRTAHVRVVFKEFNLSPQTGRFIKDYVDQLSAEAESEDSAMFPESMVLTEGSARERPSTDMFFGHCTADALRRVFISALREIAPPTERLDYAPIPISPRRFRYTLGTRMAEEGASRAVIADALGHADLQNVGVYFEASPKIVENIDKAMDALLAPLANAFRGRLVEDEEHSTHKGAPGSRIIDLRVSTAPLASCSGKGSGCAFNKPVACYTCFKFEPWLDAPHEKILARLEAERARLADDPQMARINDDAINAVRQVIAECEAVRAQRAGGAPQ